MAQIVFIPRPRKAFKTDFRHIRAWFGEHFFKHSFFEVSQLVDLGLMQANQLAEVLEVIAYLGLFVLTFWENDTNCCNIRVGSG